MAQLFTNNASALLQSSVSAGDTAITLGPGDGAGFPQPVSGDASSFAVLTLEDTDGNFEIVKLTARNGDILTVARGQEGTTPRGFAAGDRVELRMTAGTLDAFQQKSERWFLRGASLDIDGQNIYHLNDEALYKNFTLLYTTLDDLNLPALWWRGPIGVSGLSYIWQLAGPDGENRRLRFSGAITAAAPFPAQDEVALDVPGVLRLSNLSRPNLNSNMYMTWDTNVVDGIEYSRCKFEPDNAGDGLVSYRFVCRGNDGAERDIIFDANGDIVLAQELKINISDRDIYPTADALVISHEPSPAQPDFGDQCRFTKQFTTQRARWFEVLFFVRDVQDVNSETPVITQRPIRMRRDGNVNVVPDPVLDGDLACKRYVDSKSAGNRVTLFTGTQFTGDPDETLDQSVLDFNQIVVVGRVSSDSMTFNVALDTSAFNLGIGPSGRIWLLGYDTTATAANFGIRFTSNTTFEVIGGGSGAVVERVVGVFPV